MRAEEEPAHRGDRLDVPPVARKALMLGLQFRAQINPGRELDSFNE
jgi:hypothetical protein